MKTYAIIFIDLKWYSLDLSDKEELIESLNFSSNDTVITFQHQELLRELKKLKFGKLPIIIDLKSFDKQFSQEGKNFKSKPWNTMRFLQKHEKIDSEFKLFNNNFKLFLQSISEVYEELLKNDEIEKERFEQIEIKINEIIHIRQSSGLNINYDLVKKKCLNIEREIYQSKNRLQINHNIFTPSNLDFQEHFLKDKKYNIVNFSLKHTFKARSESDEVCKLIYELIRNQEDLDSLLYVLSHWGSDKKTYPIYNGFGTITSRIILTQPSIQNLRRKNRDIITTDKYKKILYIDYSQFEAGILASLSNDQTLIDLYNTGIYDDLVDNAPVNSPNREQAKITFYRFMYGDTTLHKQTKLYFEKFKNLTQYKISIENEILQTGKIGTTNGNFRKSNSDEDIWALSHKIQSTASLIYKNAVIRVDKEVTDAQFLIPMHDGTVYQLLEDNYDVIKAKIEIIYIEEFQKICPLIKAKVNCKDKFE